MRARLAPSRCRAAVAATLAVLAFGCVDRSTPGHGGGGGAGADGAGGGGAAPLEALTVRVIDPSTGLGLASMPVVVALVGGDRREAETDDTGHARVELALDEISAVLTHRNNRSFGAATRARIERDADGSGFVELESRTLVGLFHGENETPVEGAIQGAATGATELLLTQTGHGVVHDGPLVASYASTAPAGEPFSLVALAWTPIAEGPRGLERAHHAWVVASHAGIFVPTTIDLDFAAPIAPTTLDAVVDAPSDPFVSAAVLDVVVTTGPSLDASAWIGRATRTERDEAGHAYALSLEHVAIDGASPRTHYLLRRDDGGRSEVVAPGLPVAGAIDPGFVVPPRVESPTGTGPHAWSTPIRWALVEGSEGELVVRYRSLGVTIGLARLDPSDRALTLPSLPASSSYLAPGPIEALVEVSRDADGDGLPERRAHEAPLAIASPLGAP